MKASISNISKSLVMSAAVSFGLVSCQPSGKSEFKLEQQGDTLTLVHITNPTKYLLLPVEEKTPEGQVCLVTGDAADTDMDVRLAKQRVDNFVRSNCLRAQRKRLYASARHRRTPFAGAGFSCPIRSTRQTATSSALSITIRRSTAG